MKPPLWRYLEPWNVEEDYTPERNDTALKNIT